MDFKKIGSQLKQAREQRGLNHEQIFDHIKIQPHILKDIEEGESSLAPAFLKGFIKTYAEFLSITVSFDSEHAAKEIISDNDEKISSADFSKDSKTKSKFGMIFVIALCIIVGAVFYLNQNFKTSFEHKKNVNDEKSAELPEKLSENNNEFQNVQNKLAIQEQSEAENKIENNINPENSYSIDTFEKKIKHSVFAHDIFMRSDSKLKFYFKIDDQNLETRTLPPDDWYSIRAHNKIYLRFQNKNKDIQVFYNGSMIRAESGLFEKTFK